MKIVNVWSVLFFLSDFLDFSVFMCVFNNLLFYLLKNMFYVAVLSELCLKYIQELVGLGGKVKMNEIRMRVVAVVVVRASVSVVYNVGNIFRNIYLILYFN